MTYKLLGVCVSNDLKWNHHVEVIVQKGNRRLYSLRPVLEYAAPVWQNIPDFLSYKIESIQKRAMRIIFPLMSYNEALNALNLTTLSDSRAHLCQVYIDRLRNENHPLHFMLPKQEEVVHNYNLRPGISRSTRPTCRTKRMQEFVTHKYT